MSIELLIEGRIVQGHPITRKPVTKDNAAGVAEPVIDQTSGLQATETFFAIAIPKNGVADWRQTPWGQQIAQQALADWPTGEHGAATFAWKIHDGDSTVPNRRGKVPNQRSGWAGNWIISLSTRLIVRAFHVGKYDPTQQIQNENEIKCGDYGRVLVQVKGNAPAQSPGMYINPVMFEMQRAGEIIVGEGTSAADAFGGGAVTQTVQSTAGAAVIQAGPAMAQTGPAVGPAVTQAGPDFLNGPTVAVEVKYLDSTGKAFTEAELLGYGITAAQIATMQKAP